MKRWRHEVEKEESQKNSCHTRVVCSSRMLDAFHCALLGSAGLHFARTRKVLVKSKSDQHASTGRTKASVLRHRQSETPLYQTAQIAALMPFFRASFTFFLASFLSPVFILFLVSLRFRLIPVPIFFPSPFLFPFFSLSRFLCESN